VEILSELLKRPKRNSVSHPLHGVKGKSTDYAVCLRAPAVISRATKRWRK
jgi:hypothetical protein